MSKDNKQLVTQLENLRLKGHEYYRSVVANAELNMMFLEGNQNISISKQTGVVEMANEGVVEDEINNKFIQA